MSDAARVDGLATDIRLYLGHVLTTTPSSKPRVQVSVGVTPGQTVYDSVPYDSSAFVPSALWQLPTLSERISFCSTGSPQSSGTWISVVRLPQDIIVHIQACGLHLLDDELQIVHATKSGACRAAFARASTFAQRFLRVADNFTELGLGIHAAGLPTVTRDPSTDRLIGLHLDNWDQQHAAAWQRAMSRTRMVINVGRDDRYLLYIPLSVQRMQALLDAMKEPETTPGWQTKHIETYFLQRFPTCPVIKLRIAPYEAYIAPTENIAHDGCTIGQACLDLSLTFLGHFGPSAMQARVVSHNA